MTETDTLPFDEWTKQLVLGSIKAITLDERGKKQTLGDMAGWNKLTTSTVNNEHNIRFALTGVKSGVVVIDFDNKKEFHDLTNTHYNRNILNREPILDASQYPTVETKNGFHIYFKYTDQLLQPDKNLLNVDIQGNNKRVYYAGSKYAINETDTFEYKWINETSLKPVPETLMNYINGLSKKKPAVAMATPIAVANNIDDPDGIAKLKEISAIIDIQYITDRSSWLKLVFAMKRSNLDEAFVKEWSKKSPSSILTNEDWHKTWNSEDDRTDGVNTATIYYYAKLSNPTKFYELTQKYKPVKEFNLDKTTERSLAVLYDKLEGNSVVYCEDDLEFYCWFKNKWRLEDKDGSFVRTMITDRLTDYFNTLLISIRLDTDTDPRHLQSETMKILDIMKQIEKTNWLNNIWKELQSIVKCKCAKVEFDMNPDIIGFNNNKYNFKTKEWSPIVYDDFISLNTGNEWIEPTKEQTACIERLFEEIFPNPEIRRSYLSLLYSACIGGKKDKFVIANGGGANGKGLINELMKILLGDYAYEAPVSLLTREFKSGANPELANIHKKRLVLFKEPDATETLCLGNIKTLVDNDTVNARQLYKGICKTILNATLFMELNVKLKFSGKPTNAEIRRFMDILFESTFTDDENLLNDKTLSNIHPMNKHYKSRDFQTSHLCSLFKYIIDNADTEIYNPECVRERTKCYIEGEDTFANWYKEEYEITGNENDLVKVKDMFEKYKASDDYVNMKKEDRPNLNRFTLMTVETDKHLNARFKKVHQYRVDGGKSKTIRSVLVGMRLNKDELDDEDA
jgi:phage/plasmid-associated DNA primase